MALFTGIDTSDDIRATAGGRTMHETRFWATEEYMKLPALLFLDSVGEELTNRGHSYPWSSLFEDMAAEDWRTYWRMRGEYMRDWSNIWQPMLGMDLARDEFATRLRQHIEGAQDAPGPDDVDLIISIALQEYDEYEKGKDQEMLGGTP